MRIRARLIAAAAAAAAATAGLFPAAADATHPATPLRAGYLATTNPNHNVAVTVVVPNVRCAKSGRRAVAVGAFGTLTETNKRKTTTHAWAAVVRTVCTDGTKFSKAIFTNHVNASTSMPVRPGDRVKLTIDQAQFWSITDGSSGEAGTGPLPADEHITANKGVLFGAQLSAPTLPQTPVQMLRVRNGRKPLANLHPVARIARHSNHIVARPSAVGRKTGAFTVAHI